MASELDEIHRSLQRLERSVRRECIGDEIGTRTGRVTEVDRADVGAEFFPCLNYKSPSGRPELATFYVHAEATDADDTRANIESLFRAELQFGVGGAVQTVEFDARNAVLTVPAENAQLRVRYLTNEETDYDSVRVTAHGVPGTGGRAGTPLLWTSEELSAGGGVNSGPIEIPRFAYGVQAHAVVATFYELTDLFLVVRSGNGGAGTGELQMRADAPLADGQAAFGGAMTRHFVPLLGTATHVGVGSGGGGAETVFRFVFALRV